MLVARASSRRAKSESWYRCSPVASGTYAEPVTTTPAPNVVQVVLPPTGDGSLGQVTEHSPARGGALGMALVVLLAAGRYASRLLPGRRA